MILFTIAERNRCQYCSATNELTCRTLGVDEETLQALVNDLGSVSPERLKAIIEFAVKAAKQPQDLGESDYEKVRDQGLSDAELVEIIFLAAIGNLNDTLADALKFPIEAPVIQALGRA
jgi:alkylhydroperoxidase family enzyme